MGRVEDAEVDSIDAFRIVVGRTELERLEAAISALPKLTRALFLVFRLENMTQDQIAAIYGISTRSVKRHVARAMARSEERRGGKECGSTGRCRWSPDH